VKAIRSCIYWKRFDSLVGENVVQGFVFPRLAMRATRAAGPCAGAQRIVDNGLDGARTAATFGAAAEAAVNLLGTAGKVLRRLDGTADIVVAKHVTGTDDH
jgi:hypothetical protein